MNLPEKRNVPEVLWNSSNSRSDRNSENNSAIQKSAEQIFQFYDESGFLYEAKKKRLEPHLSEIKATWKQSVGHEEIHRLFWSESNLKNGKSASATVSTWRTTLGGWHTQHMVNSGTGMQALSDVCQAMVYSVIDDPDAHSIQFWFRKTNRFANRFFRDWGVKFGWVGDFSLMECDRSMSDSVQLLTSCKFDVQAATSADLDDIKHFVRNNYSEEFVIANEYDCDDLRLQELGCLYQKRELARSRELFIVRESEHRKVIGMSASWHGPLGLNFSFLESRLDLMTEEELDADAKLTVAKILLYRSLPLFKNLQLDSIPVVVLPALQTELAKIGLRHVRDYSQTIICEGGG